MENNLVSRLQTELKESGISLYGSFDPTFADQSGHRLIATFVLRYENVNKCLSHFRLAENYPILRDVTLPFLKFLSAIDIGIMENGIVETRPIGQGYSGTDPHSYITDGVDAIKLDLCLGELNLFKEELHGIIQSLVQDVM